MENFWGKYFHELPEMQRVREVIERSNQGILLQGKSANRIANLIQKVYKAEGLIRIAALLETLYIFSECNDFQTLSSAPFNHLSSAVVDVRIRNIFDFTQRNLNAKVNLKAVADIAGLTENSFCRFFKSSTGKTYFEFLAEARVAQACKLLMDGSMSIKEVCFNSGFDNVTCFFSKFKSITGKTPLQYKREVA